MANFILNNTASDINDALQKVITPDTEPQQNDNLITSGGVKTYVDGAVGDFAGKTITTEATGIENTDNDTSIPTSAAVLDYVNQFGPAYAGFYFVLSGGAEHGFSSSLKTLFTAVVPTAGYYNMFGSFQIATWGYNNNNPYTLVGVLSVNGTTIYSSTGTFTYRNYSSSINPPSAVYLPAGNLSFRISSSSGSGTFKWQSGLRTIDGPAIRYVKVG